MPECRFALWRVPTRRSCRACSVLRSLLKFRDHFLQRGFFIEMCPCRRQIDVRLKFLTLLVEKRSSIQLAFGLRLCQLLAQCLPIGEQFRAELLPFLAL